LFPELKKDIAQNPGPLDLRDDLYIRLERGYEAKPINEDLVRRIYDSAAWCFRQPQTNDIKTDLSNAAAVGLMENLPLDKPVSEDSYRWLSLETFRGCERLFRHHLSDENYQRFSNEFIGKKVDFAGTPRL
jgi:hypothetical protein